MSASSLDGDAAPGPNGVHGNLLARLERLVLGLQLTVAMLAAGLLLIALGWEMLASADDPLPGLIAALAALLVTAPVIAAAWKSLLRPSLHGVTDLLIALAVAAAWASGDLTTAALLPIVMILAHVLEERSLLGSREAVRALSRLSQATTCRIRNDGAEETVSTSALRPGERVRLRAGDRVPADGIVLQGTASIDVASLTGESLPVDVGPGSAILAGSINTNGVLEVEVERVGAETTLGKIIGLLREAERAKPPVSRLLERYAGAYLTLVLMIAASTWLISGNVPATLAVLVAACPCALVLAAPATAIAAIAVAARHGILIKGAAFLESLAEVTSVIFDKTGTLTTGSLWLVEVVPVGEAAVESVLLVAGVLGQASSHPVSRAAAEAAGASEAAADEVREIGGFGMTGILGTDPVAFGRPEMFGHLSQAAPPRHEGPIAGVSRGNVLLGWMLFQDRPRREAAAAVAELRTLGLSRQMLLTGDRASVANIVAGALEIPVVVAEALPDEKMRWVLKEIAKGQRPLVVGDGINDSLALKAGAVGVAMGVQGTDVALASADLVLMSSDLRRLATAMRLSRLCRRTIHWNVALGLGWTVLLVALAAFGMLGASGAIVAALLHNVSTFAGMANAGRLLRFDETRVNDKLQA